MISIIHPSRGRPEKSKDTMVKWWSRADCQKPENLEIIASLDEDDQELSKYSDVYDTFLILKNRSAIDAINNAANIARGDILMVVSDDTEPIHGWDVELLKEVKGKYDWILKTQDGIQKYIITNPIMDRAYYNRFGYIYHPDFQHLFCDTWLTVMADITGRKITSNLMFKHNHYSVNGTPPDELHKRNDATWKQGEDTFIKLLKTLSPEDLKKIEDPSMRNWIRNKGIRV